MSQLAAYSCMRCGAHFPADMPIDSKGCPHCFEAQAPANLQVVYEPPRNGLPAPAPSSLPSLWRYAAMLPCTESEAVSLGEGLTPFVVAETIGAELDLGRLFIKDEGRNPTWSHKDRFSTVAVSAARQQGCRVMVTASSGNAGASLAAYAARAGLRCVVATFAGTAGPMLAQIRKYGATVVTLPDKADRWPFVAEGARRFGWMATSPFHAPVVGSHPLGIEGYKTIAYEIVDQMHGSAPDWCALPVCYGDALWGVWQGFKDLHRQGRIDRLPRLVAAEVHGSLAAALVGKQDPVPEMPAVFEALAVSIGTTRSTYQALNALRESRGIAVPIGNDGLVLLQERLARQEGVFAELAAVTPFAAIDRLRRDNIIRKTETVVAIVTASGLKDLDRSANAHEPSPTYRSTAEAWEHLQGDVELCGTATGM